MTITTTVTMLYIGNFADVDTSESDANAENLSPIIGATASDTSGLQTVAVTNIDVNNDGAIYDNEFSAYANDSMQYDLGGGAVSVQADTTLLLNVSILLGDGSTIFAQVLGIQTTNGDLFISDLLNSGSLDNLDIQSITIDSVDSHNYAGYYSNQSADNINIVCFARGTAILSANGEIPVELLSVDDLVRTVDNGNKPILWINSRKLSKADLINNPKFRPIRISAGALGAGLPLGDLVVSPQHRVLIESPIVQRMFDTDEVLVAAKHLTDIEGIDIAEDIEEVEYFHFLFDQHEVVFAEGASLESFYTGPMALNSVSRMARAEIFALFPFLAEVSPTTAPKPARVFASGRRGKTLASRHARNSKPLVGRSSVESFSPAA